MSEGSARESKSQGERMIRFRIGHCRELLTEILARADYPADRLFARFFANRRYLGSHDRGYIADTIYAVLRDLLRLRYLLGDSSGLPPEREAPLLLGAHLVEGEEPVPAAALREVLDIDSGTIGDLRGRMHEGRERIESMPEPERSALRYSVPIWFADRVLKQMGEEEGSLLLASLGEQAPITLRANALRTTRDELAAVLRSRGIPSIEGRWSPDALILAKRMNAHSIPEFKSGWFELQDEGSQLLSHLLDPRPNWSVFDACAGAGGKSLHMSAIMRGRGSIKAHDVNERRLMEMRPRLRRSGAQNIRVVTHQSYLAERDRLAGTFNAVMIDAPCSGAGVLRRNPGARLTFEEGMVERLNVVQGDILREYAGLVKPGGVLLYATCSLLREENEDQVRSFLETSQGWSIEPLKAPEEMITEEGFFRCFPHRHGTDAFFAALLRKR